MTIIAETREKALEINLDPTIYGTIAEIGGGQEVARHFFQAGSASGTVAKSISAYDMVVSDTIYGQEKNKRYVVEGRVRKMLGREFDQLIERLSKHRPKESRYFAFADTVATSSRNSGHMGHGWLGVRFQHEAGTTQASQVIVHLNLKDDQVLPQQYAISVVGLNLIHSCFYKRENFECFVKSLCDNIGTERVEIDYIRAEGPAFDHLDNRLLSLELVKQNFTNSICFRSDGGIFLPQEEFYKKNILVVRGSFRPPTLVSLDMVKCGVENFARLNNLEKDQISVLAEITMNNLDSWGDNGGEDFLARVDLLGPLGLNVMVSNNQSHYKVSDYLNTVTGRPVGMVMGVYNLKEMFEEKYYEDLKGGILESFGVLMKNRGMLLIYPYQDKNEDSLTAKDLDIADNLKFLYEHLLKTGLIIDMKGANKELLHIYSRRVIDLMNNGDDSWEKMVPESVVKTIKDSCLFGHCEI